jgi:hypothetical protein
MSRDYTTPAIGAHDAVRSDTRPTGLSVTEPARCGLASGFTQQTTTYWPRCPDFTDVACGFPARIGTGGFAIFCFGAGACCDAGCFFEKSGMVRCPLRFMPTSSCTRVVTVAYSLCRSLATATIVQQRTVVEVRRSDGLTV